MTPPPDDDQDWLDLMAGRAAPDADARTRKEAAWLRAAMLSYRVTAPEGGPAPADDRVARLLTRAREAGVLPAAANDGDLPVARTLRGPRWPQALAAGLALCGLVLVFMPERPASDPDAPVMRGAAVQRLTSADPAPQRARLLQDLRAAHFDAQPYERLGRLGIDVALPVPLPAAQAAALQRLGLTPPDGPSLQIEFVTPPAAAPASAVAGS